MSGYEKTVASALKSRIAMADKGLREHFGDILVPTEDIIEMRGDKRRRSARKLFPGYVLVQMDVDEHSWHLVKKTPHVMRFIGGQSDAPSPISEREVERILGRIKRSGDKPQPKTQFEVGEAIRIVGGPFNDFSGSVEEVDYGRSKLKVAVVILGRSTSVDLEFSQVEKV